jgi:hypothetical protein
MTRTATPTDLSRRHPRPLLATLRRTVHLICPQCHARTADVIESDVDTTAPEVREALSLCASCREAWQAGWSQEAVRLSAHDQDHFLRALENPPEPTEALRRIMAPKGGRPRRVENPPHGPTPERIMRHYYGAKR